MRKPESIDVVSLVSNPHGVQAEWTLPDASDGDQPAHTAGTNCASSGASKPRIVRRVKGWTMIEIDNIKRDHINTLLKSEVILLVKGSYGWDVECWTPTGVAPTSSYDTAQEAGARALQLLRLREPVTPQDWPEIAGIGPNPGPPPRPSR